jgi:crotonobetainyl-CoA:carnitine CoA-transferase CaiB-like acyl-CoA transferase
MAAHSLTGKSVPPMPARHGAWAIYEPFETADGEQVFVGITSDNHWRRLCERFGRPELATDPRYGSNEARVRERPTLVPIVAEFARRHSKAELLAICEEIEIPFAPVATTEDLFDDPHLNAGGALLEIELPGGAHTRLPRLPLELGGQGFGLRRQPPAMGQHTAEILRELGLDDAAQADLEARGIIVRGALRDAAD